MLSKSKKPVFPSPRGRQNGVVLMIALIVLVAMTLAGIALVRSVDTTNVIAGNLAFQQAATHSGDEGVEAALAWLSTATSATLQDGINPCTNCGYLPSYTKTDPNGISWDAYWTTSLSGQALQLTFPSNPDTNLDSGGNKISYIIHRLCQQSGDPNTSQCSFAPPSCPHTGGDTDASLLCEAGAKQVYYRITSRIVGPRSTVSYVQAMIAK